MDDMSAKKQVIEEFMQFLQKKAGDGIRRRKGGQEFPGSEEEVMPMDEEVVEGEEEVMEEPVIAEEEAVVAEEMPEEGAPVEEEGLTGQPDEAAIQRMLSRVKRRR